MNILVFNWSDSKNPDSGGAELLTHEMEKRWVQSGHKVTHFCAAFLGARDEENVNGVRIIRRGSPIIRDPHIPVHLAAYVWYERHGKGKFDVVIDEIHGIPFFTPWYVKEKKVALICEVADKLWDVTFTFPLNVIGKTIEKGYFRSYKGIPFLTISQSSKNDLMSMSISSKFITVLPMGLSVPSRLKSFPKEVKPTCIFVGRLSKTKGIEDTIETMRIVRGHVPNIQLWIVGQGDKGYLENLKSYVRKLSMGESVKFYGYVSERKKFELMSKAHLILVSSVKEGWGLIVPEAGMVGTPTVAYNVSGLRDIITHGKNGLLCEPTPVAMAEMVKKILDDDKYYKKITEGALLRAKSFDWDETAKRAMLVLQK